MNDRTCAVIRSLLHSVRRSLLHVTSLSLIHSLLPVCSTPFVHYSSHPFTHSDSQSVSGSGTLYCTYPVVHAANKRVFFHTGTMFQGRWWPVSSFVITLHITHYFTVVYTAVTLHRQRNGHRCGAFPKPKNEAGGSNTIWRKENSCSSEHSKLCFEAPEINSGTQNNLPLAWRLGKDSLQSRESGTED